MWISNMKLKNLNNNIREISQSKSIEIADKIRNMKKDGHDVIALQTGEPDFDTPQHIIDAAYQAMKNGHTHYVSSQGIPELRESISRKLKQDNMIEADPNDEILVTPGAVHAVYSSLVAILNNGDEVIIPEPYWVAYPASIKMAGGKPVYLPFNFKDDATTYLDNLINVITDKTKILILNYPCNPTGKTLSLDILKQIAEIAQDNKLYVISDEIYEKIIFDGLKHSSIASLGDMHERTITVNGFSKSYAMTGWRVGYACANKEITSQMLKVLQYSATCATAFGQKGALSALNGPQDSLHKMMKTYETRRNIMVSKLNKINGISCKMPAGTFYAFADITESGMSSTEFSDKLLHEAKVGVIPGNAYGTSGEGYVRFSFANSIESIEKALDRIEDIFGIKV